MAGRNLGETVEKIGNGDGRSLHTGALEALMRYCDDGGLEIDNNAAPRSLRVVAPGRTNSLFAGSHGGSRSAAAIYSWIETA